MQCGWSAILLQQEGWGDNHCCGHFIKISISATAGVTMSHGLMACRASVCVCWGWRVGGRASISMQLVVWTGLNSDPYGCGCVLVYAWSGIVRVWWAWIVTNTDKWFFSLHVLLQPGKYHCCKHSKSIRLSSMRLLFVSVCRSLSLSSGCWSQHCGRAMDLKRLYALDDFSAITGWAKAINPLHMFHLRPKKQNKLICPKLRGFHFISPTQREKVGNTSSNAALLPSLFQLVAAILNLNRFWKYGLITYANEWKAIIKLSTEINGFNRGDRCNLEHCHWAKQRTTTLLRA